MRQAHEYGNLIYQIWKKKRKTEHVSWKLDETYIEVRGQWCYLYRTIDNDGHTLDIQLCKKRDHQAAYAFMKRLVKMFEQSYRTGSSTGGALFCQIRKISKYSLGFTYDKQLTSRKKKNRDRPCTMQIKEKSSNRLRLFGIS